MKSKKWRFILALAVAVCLAACQGKKEEEVKVVSVTDESVSIDWVKDYNAGLETAKKEGKPVMVFFTAPWCGYCVRLIKEVFSHDMVAKASKNLVNVWVNIDRKKNIANAYGVRGVPQVYFLDPDGKVIMLYQMPRTPENFKAVMDVVAEKYGKGAQ